MSQKDPFDYAGWAELVKEICLLITFVFIAGVIVTSFIAEDYKEVGHADNYKGTLKIAVENCNLRIVTLLVKDVVDIHDIRSLGVTSLQSAARVGCLEVVQLMAEKVDINAVCDSDKRTALHYAAEQGNLEVVKFLLIKGANPNIKERDGKKPRNLAVMTSLRDRSSDKPYKEIIDMLYDEEKRYRPEEYYLE
ncbi:ankyrin repeat domain-containing protein [Wolbachia endosymbiont of Folsomia candida]|uniref:ankyrin repeat domain-containing protein n=1 Tax=Wolbachia endosymbiont of Folsomia candida TaxID=169402 RepID=UPI000ADAEA7A|nr:ankyrin repeat domain-containing protein [Wolbachia endosymbiont of Folsomia candida]APR98626.1 ankyrin repeat domain-containing protein [Wolbachia endosymbiont of Folsomia candida]